VTGAIVLETVLGCTQSRINFANVEASISGVTKSCWRVGISTFKSGFELESECESDTTDEFWFSPQAINAKSMLAGTHVLKRADAVSIE